MLACRFVCLCVLTAAAFIMEWKAKEPTFISGQFIPIIQYQTSPITSEMLAIYTYVGHMKVIMLRTVVLIYVKYLLIILYLLYIISNNNNNNNNNNLIATTVTTTEDNIINNDKNHITKTTNLKKLLNVPA